MTEDLSRYQVPPDATVEEVDLDEVEVRLSDGSRLTEARAEQIVEELSEQGLIGRGRPSLSGRPGERSPQIGVRLPADLNERLRARAKVEGKRASEIVREALERYV